MDRSIAIGLGAGAVTIAVAVAITIPGTGFISGFKGVAFALAGVGPVAFAGAIAVAVSVAVAGVVIAKNVAFAGAVATMVTATLIGSFAVVGTGSFAIAVAISLLGTYISWQAAQVKSHDNWLRKVALVISSIDGTSFYKADLTDANFTGTTLKNTNFRQATLTRVRWRGAKELHLARPGRSYLDNSKVRQMLVANDRQDQICDQMNLRGINLYNANLRYASFIAADLSEVNLQNADLSHAKLVQAQLDQANLSNAILTGAYIEEWNITTDTQLEGVKCDYVFTRLPPDKRPDFLKLPPDQSDDPNPRRKPDDWDKTFGPGEFADFIAPLKEMLDLYHNQGDPRAIARAFQQLKENHPDANIEPISLEIRGKNKEGLLLRAETSPKADISQLHAEYFQNFHEMQARLDEKEKRLADKDKEIARLESMVETTRPAFYVQTYHSHGNTMSEEKFSANFGDVQGNVSGFAMAGKNVAGVAGNDLSGSVTQTINELPDSSFKEQLAENHYLPMLFFSSWLPAIILLMSATNS